MLALIAGSGQLPRHVSKAAAPAVICELLQFPSGLPGAEPIRIEHLGSVIADLKSRGITEVCLAGAIGRPPLDPSAIDAATMPLVPQMMMALRSGDDAALRAVLAFFEEAGLRIAGAHELAPDLLPKAGIPTAAQPRDRDRSDAARGAAIMAAMGAADVGQSCVIAGGQAIALEAAGGTDWMLASIAGDRRPEGASGGVLYKAPKPLQDRRVDLPVIGPETVAGVKAAGLSGVVIASGGVMVLDLEMTIAAADACGLFLWVREE